MRTVFKADRVAADRALNAACYQAIREIRAGDVVRAEVILLAAGVTATFLLGEELSS